MLITKLESHIGQNKERYLVSIVWRISLSGGVEVEQTAGQVWMLSDFSVLVSTLQSSADAALSALHAPI